jgi:TonB family protein
VKILVARLTVAAAVLAGLPSFAAGQPNPLPAPPPSPVRDAMLAAAMELQGAAGGKGTAVQRLDALTTFKHTPETAQKLLKVFGNDHPFKVARSTAPKGQLAYRLSLQPLDYRGDDGGHTEWTELSALATVGNGGRALEIKGRWDAFSTEDKLVRMSMRGMRLDSKQTLGAGGLWYGKAQIEIDSVKAGAVLQGAGMSMDDIRVTTGVVQRAKVMDVHYGVSIKSIAAAGEQVDAFHLGARVTNLDIGQMAEFNAAAGKASADLKPAQRLAAMEPMFKRFASAMLARGTAIEIDDLSARYRGNTASLKGRIGLEGDATADLDNLAAVFKKIVARFEVRVPVALLQDVSRAIARQQAPAGQPVNEQAIEQVAQGMTDVALGRLLGGGYARLEDGVLVSLIEIKDGKLRVNGKEIAFPALGTVTPGAPPRAPAPAPGASYMPARRMEGSGTLPPYPDEVLRQNLPLAMTARFTVGADGRVRKPSLAAASAWPEFDRAALAAIATCSYAPALRNGQPVDSPMSWKVVRDPAQEPPAGAENPAR